MTAQGGASIYYTLDGSTPTTGSTLYSGVFQITSSKTIKAIAYLAPDSSTVTTAFVQIDSTTANVPRTNLALWLKADNGVTVSGSNVTDWRDMTPSTNRSATQATGTNQPTLVANAINSLPAVSFSGTSQFMQLFSGFNSFAGGNFFIVTKPTAVTANARFFDLGNGATSDNIYMSQPTSTGASLYVYIGSTPSSVTSSNAITLNQYQLLEAAHTGSGSAMIFTNGVQGAQGTISNVPNVTRSGNYLGTNNGTTLHFQGEIAEIIIYRSALSETDRANVRGYLAARYAMYVNPPRISPAYGVFTSTQSVTIAGDPGAQFYYTTDGSTPTTGSTLYTGAFNVTTSKTVKAIAVQSFGTSAIASAFIQIDPTATFTKTDLLMWLKADNGVSSSGSNVVGWQDMTANQNNASQTTSGSEPQYVASAVAGLPAVSFNGSSQHMRFGSGFANFFFGGSYFIVTKPTAVTANARFFDIGNGATSNNIFMSEPTSTGLSLFVYNGASSSSLTASNAVTLNQYQLLGAMHGSGSATLYTNGVAAATGAINDANNITRTQNFLGVNNAGTLFFQGEIAEILAYNQILTAGQRAAIETYLFRRYQISVHAPTISPAYGVFSNQQTVTITGDSGDQFYYTLDGSTPTTSSTLYTGPFTVSTSVTVRAIAAQSYGTSPVTTGYLQIDPNTVLVPRGNLMFWLKGDFGVLTSGSDVTQWSDMSGAGNHATQTNSANRPVIVSNAISGLPAISFNGSSQYLKFGPSSGHFAAGISLFVVTIPTGTSSGRLLDVNTSGSSNNMNLSRSGASGATATINVFNGTSSSLSATDALALNQHQLLEAFQTGSSSGNIYVNSVQKATGALNNPNNTSKLNHIGTNSDASSAFYQGSIAEMLSYNRLLTATERAAVELYLMQRYQLATVVPPTPALSVATGTLSAPTPVAIASSVPVTVYFTTDGTTPTTGSSVYSKPINVYFSQTVKAIAVRDGVSSAVASATYTVDSNQWPAPSGSDTTPLNIHLQLPVPAIPH